MKHKIYISNVVAVFIFKNRRYFKRSCCLCLCFQQIESQIMVTLQTSTEARQEPGSNIQAYREKATIQTNGGLCWHAPVDLRYFPQHVVSEVLL